MKTRIIAGAAMVALLSACGSKTTAPVESDYTLSVNFGNDNANGKMAYVINYASGDKMYSVVVEGGIANFAGKIEGPTVASITADGHRVGTLILEAGENTFADDKGSSSYDKAYDEVMTNLKNEVNNIYTSLDTTLTGDARTNAINAIYAKRDSLIDATIVKNITSPVGYKLFGEQGPYMSSERFNAILKNNESLADTKRVARLKKTFDALDATSAGKDYVDFEVEYDGTVTKLSDFVKPGEYTLVDFWASWCGPCKHEIENFVKPIYEKYGDKLNVVGVTVWEEPDATKAWLEQNPLPWNIILNAQAIPTELYGINGIPCIILIGPDGKIVERDLRQDKLVAAVEAAMNPEVAPAE